jgi:plasmid stability protein
MTIVVTLNPELEALLRDRAIEQGRDVELVASELLASALDWENRESTAAIASIQQGLDDFEAGRFRSFDDFAQEQRQSID